MPTKIVIIGLEKKKVEDKIRNVLFHILFEIEIMKLRIALDNTRNKDRDFQGEIVSIDCHKNYREKIKIQDVVEWKK